jgi:GT2 family glycosyltransferase
MNTKITIGIPCNRLIKPKTLECLMNLVKDSNHKLHIVVAEEGYTISENRSYIAIQALKNNSEYLLFVDDDMTFTPDTLDKLLARKKDIIGVPYYSRKLPRESVVVYEDGTTVRGELPEGVFKCQHVGTGVMLVKMEVFNKIDRPFFNMKTHLTGFTLMGEDAWFCEKAREKGIEIWCDPVLKIGHLGDYIY